MMSSTIKRYTPDLVFFFIGVLPYWYSITMPEKTLWYWCVLTWCCSCWIVYFSFYRFSPAPLINNLVEFSLAIYGVLRK